MSNKENEQHEKKINTPPANFKLKSHLAFGFNVTYRTLRSLLLLLVLLFLFAGSLGIGIGTGYFAFLVKDTNPTTKETLEKEINDVEQISHMVYAGGEEIGTIKSDLIRTSIASDQISPNLKNAIIATEDENFEKHTGIVPKALLRAMVSDLTGLGSSSGGSTLTQQLVKQQILTDETTFKRKANEALLAIRVEKFFSKDEILTAYLNVSPFGRNNKGQNIAGVEEAARGIFGVSAKELSLPQAAFIAGLPQSPISYNPYTNTGEIKADVSLGIKRKDNVLFYMYREKMITNTEYEDAKKVDLTQEFIPQDTSALQENGYLFDVVQEEAIRALMPTIYTRDGKNEKDITNSTSLWEKYHKLAERQLRRNGYTVHSTIDKGIYDAMQQAVANYGYLVDDGYGSPVETGNVLMDNKSGKILGFIGGRDYSSNQLNHAFYTWRPAGSTMKIVSTYAPALDTGFIGSESQLSNFPTTYTGTNTNVTNYDKREQSSFESARKALAKSDNIPVINLYREMSKTEDPSVYMKKMSYEKITDSLYGNESFPLGQNDVSVVEQTSGFAALANEGNYTKGYIIDKITDTQGNVIYQHDSNEEVQVFKKATASIMNDMMRDVINDPIGTGTAAKSQLNQLNPDLANADWVGKTGTSEYESDLWFIASTPDITLSSWIGHDDNKPMATGNDQQNKIYWAYLANAIYQVDPTIFGTKEKFTLDSSVIKSEVSNFTGDKLGTFSYNNQNVKVPGESITSLYAVEGAKNSSYKFGVGGTDANYKTVWAPHLRPAPDSNNSSTKDSDKEKKPENSSDSSDRNQTSTTQSSRE